jgi:hypothetical protein
MFEDQLNDLGKLEDTMKNYDIVATFAQQLLIKLPGVTIKWPVMVLQNGSISDIYTRNDVNEWLFGSQITHLILQSSLTMNGTHVFCEITPPGKSYSFMFGGKETNILSLSPAAGVYKT